MSSLKILTLIVDKGARTTYNSTILTKMVKSQR